MLTPDLPGTIFPAADPEGGAALGLSALVVLAVGVMSLTAYKRYKAAVHHGSDEEEEAKGEYGFPLEETPTPIMAETAPLLRGQD